nr:MAG TPA: hypothetical protein [Caudoviricetes sp.]
MFSSMVHNHIAFYAVTSALRSQRIFIVVNQYVSFFKRLSDTD